MGTADRLVAAGRFAAVWAVRHQPLPAAGAAALPGGRSCCSAGSLAHDARGCIAATCRSGPPGIEAVKQVTEKGHSVAEVAARAGIGVNTVSNLEAGRNVSFENLIRVAMVLGRLQELEELFKPHLNSVDDILRYESNTARQRIKSK